VLASRTCTRSDSLANGASYPDITLYVSVPKNAPSGCTNAATGAGGTDTNTANNTASDPTKIGTLIFNDGWEQMQSFPGRWTGNAPAGAAAKTAAVPHTTPPRHARGSSGR